MSKRALHLFSVALGLLTRLGPAKLVQDEDLARAQIYFAPVGALLGIIYLSIIFILYTFFPTQAWHLAFVYLTLDVWLTRGLHYDGLADVGDAVGSGKENDEFWKVMHDSQLGAFGAIALFLALSATLIGLQNLISQEKWYALLLAPVFGRVLCVLFANVVKAKNPHSLGGKVCTKFQPTLCSWYIVLNFILMLPLGLVNTLIIHAFGAVYFYILMHLAKKHGGCNGDFFGATIVGGQCLMLFLA